MLITGINLYQYLGLQGMAAHSILTLDKDFFLPAGGKIDELFGPMVDLISKLEQKNKCLQNKNYKMFLDSQKCF